MGLKPTTYCLLGRCSTLSYRGSSTVGSNHHVIVIIMARLLARSSSMCGRVMVVRTSYSAEATVRGYIPRLQGYLYCHSWKDVFCCRTIMVESHCENVSSHVLKFERAVAAVHVKMLVSSKLTILIFMFTLCARKTLKFPTLYTIHFKKIYNYTGTYTNELMRNWV